MLFISAVKHHRIFSHKTIGILPIEDLSQARSFIVFKPTDQRCIFELLCFLNCSLKISLDLGIVANPYSLCYPCQGQESFFQSAL